MNNKDKAKEFAFYFCNEKSCDDYECIDCPKARTHPALIKMAQWKQEQMIENMVEWLSLNADLYGCFKPDKLNEMVLNCKKAMEVGQ